MTTITKEFLQQLADHHAGDEYYPLLIDLLNQPEPEPIYQWKAPYSGAWRDISKDAYLEIKGYIHNITGNGEVRVVYTHPPAPKAITALDVTDEMLDLVETTTTGAGAWDMVKPKELIAAAVNAFNGVKP